MNGEEVLPAALEHNAGLRLNSHLGSLDLFAMHFEGAAPQPKVKAEIVINTNNGIETQSLIKIKPVYYRVRTSSFWFCVGARQSDFARRERLSTHHQ